MESASRTGPVLQAPASLRATAYPFAQKPRQRLAARWATKRSAGSPGNVFDVLVAYGKRTEINVYA
jgi:hypothetical protein